LAEIPPAILALDPRAGRAGKAVAGRIGLPITAAITTAIIVVVAVVIGIGVTRAERGGRNRTGGVDRARDDAGRDIARPEPVAAIGPALINPAIIAAAPVVLLRCGVVAMGDLPLRIAGVGVGGYLLSDSRACQRRCQDHGDAENFESRHWFLPCWAFPLVAVTNKTPVLVDVPIFPVPDFKQM
jgi:hypothetical protein